MNVKGFTLVELAIVLVIMGLIVGGVLSGQELIRQAKLRSQIAQFEEINRATSTFLSKYSALPGDIKNATAYWGALSDCGDDRTGSTATCDGDGDNYIATSYISASSKESPFFWQHLGNSGLISQSFSGLIGDAFTGDSSALPGNAALQSKLYDNAYITLASAGYFNYMSYLEPAIKTGYSHAFLLGSPFAVEEYYMLDPVIAPETAYALDSKLDDGKPTTGKISVEALYISTTRCKDGSSPAQYDISNNSNTCALIVFTAF